MSQDIAGAVGAWTLAVPHAHHAVTGVGASRQRGLAAPHRCCSELFVEPGYEPHPVPVGELGCFRKRLVHCRKRAPRVTRYQACGVKPAAPVAHVLFDEQSRHGLQSCQHGRASACSEPLGKFVTLQPRAGRRPGSCRHSQLPELINMKCIVQIGQHSAQLIGEKLSRLRC